MGGVPSAGRPTRVLITSFEPFDGALTNPSINVGEALRQRFAGSERVDVAHRTLPVEFAATTALTDAIRELTPDILLSLGLAVGRERPSFERLAVNLMDARIPDNDGQQPVDGEVVPGAPTALWTTLPVKAAFVAAERAGIPVELSMSAGTFVCNAIFYQALYDLLDSDAKVGFVHVPLCETGAEIRASIDAAEILLKTALTGVLEPKIGVGALW